MTDEYSAFIRANTKLSPVPLIPPIKLYLASEATEFWQKIEEELETGIGPPPFWAFAWAGGQALARCISDQPDLVAGKKVLDFAAGSGVVSIAAMLAGARCADANDIDTFCGAAIALNAAENQVAVETRLGNLVGSEEPWDVILAGDVCYHRDIADPIIAWLEHRAQTGTLVLIGDPGRAFLPVEKLQQIASYDVPVPYSLENVTMRRTGIWRFNTKPAV